MGGLHFRASTNHRLSCIHIPQTPVLCLCNWLELKNLEWLIENQMVVFGYVSQCIWQERCSHHMEQSKQLTKYNHLSQYSLPSSGTIVDIFIHIPHLFCFSIHRVIKRTIKWYQQWHTRRVKITSYFIISYDFLIWSLAVVF